MFPDYKLTQQTFSRLFNMSNPWPYGTHLIRHTGQQTMTEAEKLLCAEWELRFAYEHRFKTSTFRIKFRARKFQMHLGTSACSMIRQHICA